MSTICRFSAKEFPRQYQKQLLRWSIIDKIWLTYLKNGPLVGEESCARCQVSIESAVFLGSRGAGIENPGKSMAYHSLTAKCSFFFAAFCLLNRVVVKLQFHSFAVKKKPWDF